MQGQCEDLGSSPSFNCYSSDSTITSTATAIAKVICEDQDFEFGVLLSDEASLKEMDFPVFNRCSITGAFEKLFIDQPDESSSSSEADELEHIPSGTYCVWQPKCKKSSSTGSGFKRWRFRRSNSEGKELLSYKKEKRSSGVEQFYVQRRAENEVGKRKSYLPYRKDLVGLFANVNGVGKMLPF